jgi:hypothetical protein
LKEGLSIQYRATLRLSNIYLNSATSSRPSHQKPPLPKRTVPDYQPFPMQGSLVHTLRTADKVLFFSPYSVQKQKHVSPPLYLRIDVSITTDWWCAMGCIGKPRRRYINQYDNGFRVKNNEQLSMRGLSLRKQRHPSLVSCTINLSRADPTAHPYLSALAFDGWVHGGRRGAS